MNPSRAPLDSFLARKRAEWSAMLLQRNPCLRQPLQNALHILAKRNVTLLNRCDTFRVYGNPHDYTVNLATRQCSCGTCHCEHFLAAWFAFSQAEIVREHIEDEHISHVTGSTHGIWRGTAEHICADGYAETSTLGFGDSLCCARCREPYSPAQDETT